MKYLKSLSESIEDDTIKSIEYQKYINKLVVYKEFNYKDEIILNYGTLNKIYFTNNFRNNVFVINITEKNKIAYSTDFSLKSITILKECDSIQEAEDYIDMINNSNKFNL
jgi:hypothetical protein